MGKWEGINQSVKSFSYTGYKNPTDLMHNIVPVVNNTILSSQKLVKRVELRLSVLITHTIIIMNKEGRRKLLEAMDMKHRFW